MTNVSLTARITTIAAAIVLTAAVLSAPQVALAVTCSVGAHCWSYAYWQSAPNNMGAIATINTSCLAGPNNSNDFATEEMWVGTNSDPNGNSWVEQGISYGESNGQPMGGPYWFWAQYPPGGPYSEHYVGPVSFNTNYVAKTKYNGGNTWAVIRDGTLLGQSTTNPPYSQYLETGEELTSNAYSIDGTSTSLKWYNTNGTLYSGWQYGGSHAVTWNGDNPPAWSNWMSQYTSVNYGAYRCGGTSPGSSAGSDGLNESVADVAYRMAAAYGDNSVTAAESLVTTRLTANAVASDSIVDSDQQTYFLQMQGHFTPKRGGPGGQRLPTGQYLVAIVDAATHQVLDSGVSNVHIDMSTLGPVSTLNF